MGSTDGFFNRLSFGWMNRVVKEGRKGDIALETLPLPAEQSADVAYGQFQGNWEAAVKSGKPNLRSVLFQTFGKDLMLAGLFKLGWSVCVIMGAFFFTRDPGRIWRVSEALEYGMVGVNSVSIVSPQAPFGGWKHSGMGSEGSTYGLEEYLEIKLVAQGGIVP